MNPKQNPINHNFLSAYWPQLPNHLRTRLFLRVWLHLNPPPRILLLPFLQFALSFILLTFLPFQQASILILLTLPLCLSIIISVPILYLCPKGKIP